MRGPYCLRRYGNRSEFLRRYSQKKIETRQRPHVIVGGGDSSRPCSGVRSGNLISKRGTAMLDEPEQSYASSSERSRTAAPQRSSSRSMPTPRHDYGDDFAADYNDEL